MIDSHYGTLATLAMETDPKTLSPSPETRTKFLEMFGVAWEDAPLLRNGDAMRLMGAGVSGAALERMWRKGPFLKLSPGCYVARLITDEVP